MPNVTLSELPRSKVANQLRARATEAEQLPAELARGDDLIWLAVDVMQAASTAFRRWRNRRRTRRELSILDARQLRDIGLNRMCLDPVARWFVRDETCRALSELSDSEVRDLSDFGRKRRRKARHGGCDEQQC